MPPANTSARWSCTTWMPATAPARSRSPCSGPGRSGAVGRPRTGAARPAAGNGRKAAPRQARSGRAAFVTQRSRRSPSLPPARQPIRRGPWKDGEPAEVLEWAHQDEASGATPCASAARAPGSPARSGSLDITPPAIPRRPDNGSYLQTAIADRPGSLCLPAARKASRGGLPRAGLPIPRLGHGDASTPSTRRSRSPGPRRPARLASRE